MSTNTIYRTVGDHGEFARVRIFDLQDADGTLITSGTVRLRAGRLFDEPMTHAGDGVWFYDPGPGVLDRRGDFPLEVLVEGSQVTVPGREPWVLSIRNPVREP